MPNSELWLADEAGRRLPPGGIGELVVRGSSLMRGYWRRPEETVRALREGPLPGEKVLHTGDWFRMDADGDLYFLGRKDDIFKCRGEKVSPKEIEAVLYELEEIAEAAVLGVPDEFDGMAIKAVLVVRSGRSIDTPHLLTHCRARLEPRLVPKFFELRSELPKTESGKIARAQLHAS
jgi:acyl-coenzyme A synthetase/AMP-(fatty) acid ligase